METDIFFSRMVAVIVTSMVMGQFCEKEYATSHAILIFNSIQAKVKDISNCVKH